MNDAFSSNESRKKLQEQLIGLGERSLGKNYYPELLKTVSNLERFKALLNESNDGIILFSVEDEKPVDANATIYSMLGIREDELKNLDFSQYVEQKDKALIARRIAGCKDTDCCGLVVTTIFPEDRPAFPVEISCKIVEFSNGVYVTMVLRDISDRLKIEEQLRDSLIEKESLLREVHHRVKNNFQIITSLLSLQMDSIESQDMKSFLQSSKDRIYSMAAVHEGLYRADDLAKVNFHNYIQELSNHILVSHDCQSRNIQISIWIEDVNLRIEAAVPCGLIINELITNSIKHAFAPGDAGKIMVEMYAEGDSWKCVVSDNGSNSVSLELLEKSESLGMTLVQTLVQQLLGTMTIDVNNGTKIAVRFPRNFMEQKRIS
ncbi:MAG: histidine kinase dimerization/phosphoacceptor domain -containing protein [Spirochaetia bacterium]